MNYQNENLKTRMNLVLGLQAFGTMVACGFLFYFFSTTNADWKNDSVALSTILAVFFFGIVGQVVLRIVFSNQIAKRSLEEVNAQNNDLNQRAVNSDPNSQLNEVVLNKLIEKGLVQPGTKLDPNIKHKNIYFLVFGFMTGLCIFGSKYWAPLHEVEVGIYLFCITLPITFALLFLYSSQTARADEINKPNFSGKIIGNCIVAVFIGIGCLQLAEIINVVFDKSASHEVVQYVLAHRNPRKGCPTMMVPSFIKSPLPEAILEKFPYIKNFEQFETIRISYKDYLQAELGTEVRLKVHDGYLGFPWAESSMLFISKPKTVNGNLNNSRPEADFDYTMGAAYFNGTNGQKDDAKAVEFFKKAADRGNRVAQHDLAYMYFNGLGTAKNTPAAFELIKQSAAQGFPPAQDYLGVMYGDGKDGAPQDWVQSYIWISRAARQGFKQAIEDLEYARQHMTPEQIAAAELQITQ